MSRVTATAACGVLALTLIGAAPGASFGSGPPRTVAAADIPLPPAGRANIGYSVVTQGSYDAAGQLVLVAPDGGHRALGATRANEQVLDTSTDARTVLTVTPLTYPRQSITTWNLGAGTKTSFAIGATTSIALVSGGILTVDYGTGTTRVRSTTNGAVIRTYPTVAGQAEAAVTPDGSTVLQRVTAGTAVRSAATGAVTRTVADPAGHWCFPRRLWDSTSAVLSCESTDPALPRQYRVVLSTGATSAVTPAGASAVWNTTPLRVVSIPEATGIPNYVGYVDAGGLRGLNLPGEPDDPHHRLTGARGSSIYVFWNGETGTPSLRRYDLSTKALTSLIGPGSLSPAPITSGRTIDALS
ncbi:hypothetical protein [Luteipulveratus mongoliensis]|uniref:Lipoprotein LpqB beta-propeller domain-containing protein n=1 Tax=Luteipulveratus mongoliensis TaxID=571913 RepID=A0A0K1JHS9_9MICO|nr:hypothetical protein [Luteipulveratus mongoliensis]AKU16264.1 hypothetical protein VV02_10965 [Luteipulveratus mongoliensis]